MVMNPNFDPELKQPYPISDTLRLRRSCKEDSDALAEFNGRIHADNERDSIRLQNWTKDMLSGVHPAHHPDDFTLVEETATGRIVSAMNLISQTWLYDGIPIKVGRPEAVGTEMEYRHQGLVRLQFETVHAWSRARGQIMQGITGIPYYYRQFGYEMTVELDTCRIGTEEQLPKLKEGETEQFTFRAATEEDIPFLVSMYIENKKHLRLTCQWDAEWFRYEISGKTRDSFRHELYIILDGEMNRIGYIAMEPFLSNQQTGLLSYNLASGMDWTAVTPAVLRFVWQCGQALAVKENKTLLSYNFKLYSGHPAYKAAAHNLPRAARPYTWYMRVPDTVGFLRKIKTALERNLSRSICCSHSGELRIGNYRDSLKICMEKGRITQIAPYQAKDYEDCDAQLPGHSFLHLLFGMRSVEELFDSMTDFHLARDKRALLDSLFPKKASHIEALE